MLSIKLYKKFYRHTFVVVIAYDQSRFAETHRLFYFKASLSSDFKSIEQIRLNPNLKIKFDQNVPHELQRRLITMIYETGSRNLSFSIKDDDSLLVQYYLKNLSIKMKRNMPLGISSDRLSDYIQNEA